jgi:small subunit ribosomal protein S14
VARTCLVQKSLRKPKHANQHRNRCGICGRARAYYRKFHLCRICMRRLAHKGEIPGLRKASW